MKFNFIFPDIRCQHIRNALVSRGCRVDAHDGPAVCFIENEMPRFPGWLTTRHALLWTRKHLYYKKLGVPFRTVRSLGDFLSVPYGKFWFKPSESHYIEGKFRRALVDNKVEFLARSPIMWENHRAYVAQEPIPSEEQVWVMSLWDSHGSYRALWYSTEKIHATGHPADRVIDHAVRDIGIKLGLRGWMAFMEFCVSREGIDFLDLNPRLPGDDDWHELVYEHLTGRSLGRDIATMMLDDVLPPTIKSNNVVLESEWDGKPISKNQRLWEYGDGYKQKPVLTFTKK